MRITREKGERRHVRVFYKTVAFTASDNRGLAIEGLDYENVKSFVDFMQGETEKYISVRIREDNGPEVDERFRVNITRIQVLSLNSSKISISLY